VNGDGIDDALIGAPGADANRRNHAGESYVVFGRTTAFPAAFELRSLLPAAGGDGSEGSIVRGIEERDYAGTSVSGAGDVNGDGFDDLLIGAEPNRGSDPGKSYVVFGRGGSQVTTGASPGEARRH
jgi:hypothetical protein